MPLKIYIFIQEKIPGLNVLLPIDYNTHSLIACCYFLNHIFQLILLITCTVTYTFLYVVCFRKSFVPERGPPNQSNVCRIIYYMLVTCFIVNLSGLLILQVVPAMTAMWNGVKPANGETPYIRRQEENALDILLTVPEQKQEIVLESEAFEPPKTNLSPFANMTKSADSWETVRDRIEHSELDFHINQPTICGHNTFLLIMVTSGTQNFEQRKTIRETWGSPTQVENSDVSIAFLVGAGRSGNTTLHKTLAAESQNHHDIIQTNVIDSYSNLTFKSIAMLKWMDSFCKSAKYLLKSDDDMYINIANLREELSRSVLKRFIMGDIIAGAQPVQDRRSKWFTPKSVFSERMYPKYVSGSAYVISGDLIHDLLKATSQTKAFWLEDIYITGLCAKKTGATHIYNGKFGYRRRRLSPCLFKIIVTGHRLRTQEMYRMWAALQNPHLRCSLTRIQINAVV